MSTSYDDNEMLPLLSPFFSYERQQLRCERVAIKIELNYAAFYYCSKIDIMTTSTI